MNKRYRGKKRKTFRVACIMMSLVVMFTSTSIYALAEEVNPNERIVESDVDQIGDLLEDEFLSDNSELGITEDNGITNENPINNQESDNGEFVDKLNEKEELLTSVTDVEKEEISRIDFIHDIAKFVSYQPGEDMYEQSVFADYSIGSKYYSDAYALFVCGYLPLEYGDELRPDEAVTREFAAYVVRGVLGATTNPDDYMELSDKVEITYIDAAQFVLKSGWLECIDRAFCPKKLLSKDEENALFEGVAGYYDFLEEDAHGSNVYVFASDVKVFEEDEVKVLEYNDEYVIFESLPEKIQIGQRFAFYYLGLPFAYTAKEIEYSNGNVKIYIGEQEDDALLYADASGTIDLLELGEYEEEIIESYDSVSYSDGALSFSSEYLDVKLSGFKFNYSVSENDKYVLLSGSYAVTVKYTGKVADFDPSVPIKLPIGVLKLGIEGGITGEVSYGASGEFTVGIRNGTSIQNLVTQQVFIESEMGFSIALKISYGVDILFAEVNIYAKLQFKCVDDTRVNYKTVYNPSTGTDSVTSLTCRNYAYGLYLLAGVSAGFFGEFTANIDILKIPVYERSKHYENGFLIERCTADNPPEYQSILDGESSGEFQGERIEFDPNNKEYDYGVILGGPATVETLHIINGGYVDLNGYTLTITGKLQIDVGGKIDVNGGTLYVKGNIFLSGNINVDQGEFQADGNIYNDGGIRIGDASVYVKGNVIQVGEKYNTEEGAVSYKSNTSAINMNHKNAELTICGDYYVNTTAEYTSAYNVNEPACGYQRFNQGTIALKGNLYQYGKYSSFWIAVDATLILAGEGIQTLYFENTKVNGFAKNPVFAKGTQNIRFTNGLRGFELSEDLTLPGTIDDYHLDIDETMYTNGHKLTIQGDYYMDDEEINVYCSGVEEKNTLLIDGNLYQTGGRLNVAGDVEITGNYYEVGEQIETEAGEVSYSSVTAAVALNNKKGYLKIDGDYYVNTTAEYNAAYNAHMPSCGYQRFHQGTIELKGNLYQYGKYSSFWIDSDATLILAGEGIQTLYFEYTHANGFAKNPVFANSTQNIRFANGLKGFELSEDLTLPGTIDDYHLDIDETMYTNGHKLTIQGNYYMDDEEIRVQSSGTDEENALIVDGNLYQTGGQLMIGGGILRISGNYHLLGKQSVNEAGNEIYDPTNAVFTMYNPASVAVIEGDFVTNTVNTRSLISEGRLELSKNLECLGKRCCFRSDTAALVCLNGKGQQKVVNETGQAFIGRLKLSNDVSNYNFENGKFWHCVEVDKPGVIGYQASVDGAVELNYCVLASDGILERAEEVYMTACVGDKAEKNIYPVFDNESGYYKFCVPVSARQMADKISTSLIIGEDSIKLEDYSVKEYTSVLISDEKYQNYAGFAKAMLNYGGYAQVYFDHNTTHMANEGLYNSSNDPVKKTDVGLEDSKYNVPKLENTDLEYKGMSLTCKDRTNLNLYYSLDKEWEPEDIEVTAVSVRNANITYMTEVVKTGQLMKIKIINIPAAELDELINIQIMNKGQLELSASYTPMMYVKTVQKVHDEKLKNLVNAIYLYNREAKEISR